MQSYCEGHWKPHLCECCGLGTQSVLNHVFLKEHSSKPVCGGGRRGREDRGLVGHIPPCSLGGPEVGRARWLAALLGKAVSLNSLQSRYHPFLPGCLGTHLSRSISLGGGCADSWVWGPRPVGVGGPCDPLPCLLETDLWVGEGAQV